MNQLCGVAAVWGFSCSDDFAAKPGAAELSLGETFELLHQLHQGLSGVYQPISPVSPSDSYVSW